MPWGVLSVQPGAKLDAEQQAIMQTAREQLQREAGGLKDLPQQLLQQLPQQLSQQLPQQIAAEAYDKPTVQQNGAKAPAGLPQQRGDWRKQEALQQHLEPPSPSAGLTSNGSAVQSLANNRAVQHLERNSTPEQKVTSSSSTGLNLGRLSAQRDSLTSVDSTFTIPDRATSAELASAEEPNPYCVIAPASELHMFAEHKHGPLQQASSRRLQSQPKFIAAEASQPRKRPRHIIFLQCISCGARPQAGHT